jgi:hypothetical protein
VGFFWGEISPNFDLHKGFNEKKKRTQDHQILNEKNKIPNHQNFYDKFW